MTLGRYAAWLAFFGLLLAAWGWLFLISRHLGHAHIAPGALLGMWVVMMAAMMAPTLVPTLRDYEGLIRAGAGSRAGFWTLLAGYLATWALAALVFGAAHLWLIGAGLVDRLGGSLDRALSAALLTTAGLYQFSRLKARCLSLCRSPFERMMAHWRPGAAGGLRIGLAIGLSCLGCCWAIMALGFVGGAMSLWWMGAATAMMVLEKLPDLGRWLTAPLGIAFLGAGVLTWAGVI